MKSRTLVLLVSLAFAAPALAQPKDAGEAAYQAGRKAYDLREWDKAIEEFKQAYRIRSDAASLFNIAQSYRLKGDCGEALGFYKTYKRNFPTAQNISAVDQFITEMETCAKEQATKQPPPPAAPPQTKPEQEPIETAELRPPPPARDSGKGKRTAGIVMGVAGVALVGTGFAFGMSAKGKADDITSGGDPSNPPEFDGALEDSGKRADLLAKISWSVGGAAVVGGVVLYMLGRSASSSELAIAPTTGGATFAWRAEF
ncbi:MAG: tetratricopeptide repeat protein [Deltaproteobacteria bacterium]|nr:tetratricopeptide repeat protein [Deltaproteobacteria bacterium]MDQ3295383.1 tetratricopeptide repeat protein [Myxococcota bacterium]